MEPFDYCPFCGSDEVKLVKEPHHFGDLFYVKCGHCAAQGGSFVEPAGSDDIESVVRDWNQRSLRARTICDRVRKAFVQLEYDITTLWGRR